jgi:hypothetical protein
MRTTALLLALSLASSGCASSDRVDGPAPGSPSTTRLPDARSAPPSAAPYDAFSAPDAPPGAPSASAEEDGGRGRGPGETWKACIISRADLEAETGEPATIAPAAGQVLLVLFVRRWSDDYAVIVRETLGLPGSLPTGTPIRVSGHVRHQLVEAEGAVEGGDTLDGTLTVDATTGAFHLTLDARDMFKRMFSQDAALHNSTVTPKRVRATRDCK